MSIAPDEMRRIVGATAYDRDGDKIGTVGQLYQDDTTKQPKWITVNTGLFGLNESFVPLQGAQLRGGEVIVAYEKAIVKDAPHVAEDGHLSPEEEQRLYQHYQLAYPDATGYPDTYRGEAGEVDLPGTVQTSAGDQAGAGVADRAGAVGHDTSGPTTDEAMTRSEEHLRVGTERTEAGRARLRKYVVTENVQQTIPVSHEEVRIEREPITDANRTDADGGPPISEEEHEVTLHAERPVVGTEAEAVERVRLDTDTVTELSLIHI